MSADNFVGIYPSGSDWIVTDGSASREMEDCQYRGGTVNVFPTYEQAVLAAHEYAKTLPVLEYGVGTLSAITEPCGRCFVCVNERKIVDKNIERCDFCHEPITSDSWMTVTGRKTYHNNCEWEVRRADSQNT
jgi:hypothetical protein